MNEGRLANNNNKREFFDVLRKYTGVPDGVAGVNAAYNPANAANAAIAGIANI